MNREKLTFLRDLITGIPEVRQLQAEKERRLEALEKNRQYPELDSFGRPVFQSNQDRHQRAVQQVNDEINPQIEGAVTDYLIEEGAPKQDLEDLKEYDVTVLIEKGVDGAMETVQKTERLREDEIKGLSMDAIAERMGITVEDFNKEESHKKDRQDRNPLEERMGLESDDYRNLREREATEKSQERSNPLEDRMQETESDRDQEIAKDDLTKDDR